MDILKDYSWWQILAATVTIIVTILGFYFDRVDVGLTFLILSIFWVFPVVNSFLRK